MTQVQILPPVAKFLKKLHGRNQRKFLRGIKALYAYYITVHICITRIIPRKLISTSRGLFY